MTKTKFNLLKKIPEIKRKQKLKRQKNFPLKKIVKNFSSHSYDYRRSNLVSNDEVWVDGGAGPGHDWDEHGEGGEDEVHVEDERDEEGGQVDEKPLEISGFTLGRVTFIHILQQPPTLIFNLYS